MFPRKEMAIINCIIPNIAHVMAQIQARAFCYLFITLWMHRTWLELIPGKKKSENMIFDILNIDQIPPKIIQMGQYNQLLNLIKTHKLLFWSILQVEMHSMSLGPSWLDIWQFFRLFWPHFLFKKFYILNIWGQELVSEEWFSLQKMKIGSRMSLLPF